MKIKLVMTAGEMLDSGYWDAFCEKRGINEWAMNEGLMDSDEEFSFTLDEAVELGMGYRLKRELEERMGW